jgi:hypothetical protein
VSIRARGRLSAASCARARNIRRRRYTATRATAEPLGILADDCDVRQRVADRVRDRAEHIIADGCQPIVHPQPVAARVHEAGLSQVREMARSLRLRNLQAFVDVAHADIAREQQAQNPEPRAVGQRPKERFHILEPMCHIFALTNIPCPPTVHIFVNAYMEVRNV